MALLCSSLETYTGNKELSAPRIVSFIHSLKYQKINFQNSEDEELKQTKRIRKLRLSFFIHHNLLHF